MMPRSVAGDDRVRHPYTSTASRRSPIKTSRFSARCLAGLLATSSFIPLAHADDIDASSGDDMSTTSAAPTAPAQTPAVACNPGVAEVPIASEVGSAGIMFNLAEHPDSIRAVAGRLLNEALDRQKKAPPAEACEECAGDRKPSIVYEVKPIHLLDTAEQEPVCVKLDAQTRAQPFEFPPRHFKSIGAMNEWVMAFSQGRGDEGKDLYRRCEANCSPSYQFVIEPDTTGLQVQTRVHCGLARDRGSDEYEVSTALRDNCEAPAQPVADAAY